MTEPKQVAPTDAPTVESSLRPAVENRSTQPEPVRAALFRLARPVLAEQAMLYLVGLSDTILTGIFLSRSELAAVSVCGYLSWFLGNVWLLTTAGALALVAQRIGAGRWDEARAVTGQAIGLAVLVGLASGLIGLLTAATLLEALNLQGQSLDAAIGYWSLILLAAPALAVLQSGIACLRGAGDTRTGFRIMVLVNLINVPVSWALAIGLAGLPRLGLLGVACGTVCGELVGAGLLLTGLFRGWLRLRITWSDLRPDWERLRRIVAISLPAAIEGVFSVSCHLWFLSMINRLGEVATAAHGLAIRCESLAYLSADAFAVAASTMVGQALGADDAPRARRCGRSAWLWCVLTLSLIGVVFLVGAPAMFAAFLGGWDRRPDVLAAGVPALRLVAFAMPAMATFDVLRGALRGAGINRPTLGVVLVGFLGIRIPMTAWLMPMEAGPVVGLGVAWTAMCLDLLFRGLAMAALFLEGSWSRHRL